MTFNFKKITHDFFVFIVVFLIFLSIPIWGVFNISFFAVLDHLRFGYIFLSIILLFISGLYRSIIMFFLVVIVLLSNLLIVIFGSYSGSVQGAGSMHLNVVHANIWFKNPNLERVAEMLNRESPDVVSIVELTDPEARIWQSRLNDRWPYRIDCAPAGCGNMILSRWPATVLEARSGWHDGPLFPSILAARIHHPEGDFTFVVIHLNRPTEPERQTKQAEWLGQRLSGLPQPVIMAGDFNAAPWSGTMKIIEKADMHRIAHTGPTWPSGPLIFTGIPIDHILGSPGVSATGVERLPPFGSDHLALKAEIALTPQPVATPAKPAGEGGGTPALVPAP
jgi:endonuclease/exonuclease/phosphatase (EEP) superfamily protein YafD